MQKKKKNRMKPQIKTLKNKIKRKQQTKTPELKKTIKREKQCVRYLKLSVHHMQGLRPVGFS